MSYTGNKPEFSVLDVETFPTNGVLKSFTLKYKAGGPNAVDVYINNVWQEPFEAYSLVGKELSFDEAPPTGEMVVRYKAIEGVTQYGKTVSDEANPNTVVERRADGSIAAASSTEAGSVLVKGDYGIGGTAIPYTGNLDAVSIPSGFYLVGPSATGVKPSGQEGGYGFVQIISLADRNRQIWYDTSLSTFVYTREYQVGTNVWQPWVMMYNQGNIVGQVSQSAGIPTGAIIQRGSNANGEFTRFADGTLICSVSGGQEVLTNGALVGSFYVSGSLSFTYPSGFSKVEAVTTTSRTISGPIFQNNYSVSNTGFVAELWGANTTRQGYMGYIAYGRWF